MGAGECSQDTSWAEHQQGQGHRLRVLFITGWGQFTRQDLGMRSKSTGSVVFSQRGQHQTLLCGDIWGVVLGEGAGRLGPRGGGGGWMRQLSKDRGVTAVTQRRWRGYTGTWGAGGPTDGRGGAHPNADVCGCHTGGGCSWHRVEPRMLLHHPRPQSLDGPLRGCQQAWRETPV